MKSVSAVIVSYNSCEDLPACLHSLSAQSALTEVVVLDNGSSDGSADLVERMFPEVVLIRESVNHGFAKGCNLAAERASGGWLLFFNPDAIAEPGMVEALLDFASRRPDVGIYGGRLIDESGQLDPHSCWGFPSVWSSFCFAVGASSLRPGSRIWDPESIGGFDRDHEREVGVVTGCLLLIATHLYSSLDGFDETYFLYGEDADLSSRARGLGFRPAITPNALARHHRGRSSSSSDERARLLYTGKVTLLRRRLTPWRSAICVQLLVLGVGLRALPVPVRGSSSYRDLWTCRGSWRQGFTNPAPDVGHG